MCVSFQCSVNDDSKRFEINSHLVCSAAGNSDCDSQHSLSVSFSLKTQRVKNVSFTWKREASLSKHQPESRATENRLWLGRVVTLTLPCRSANQEPWWGLLDPASGTWPTGRCQSHWLILFHLGSCHRLIGPVSTKKSAQRFHPILRPDAT